MFQHHNLSPFHIGQDPNALETRATTENISILFPFCFQPLLTTSELIRERGVVLFAWWFVCYCLHEIQV